MENLLNLLKENLLYAGRGEECVFFTWACFSELDLFFIFPATRYFAVYLQDEGKVEFYRIVNSTEDIPKDSLKVHEKTYMDGTGIYLEAYYCQVSAYDIIQKFGKRHKYLLYELDLL